MSEREINDASYLLLQEDPETTSTHDANGAFDDPHYSKTHKDLSDALPDADAGRMRYDGATVHSLVSAESVQAQFRDLKRFQMSSCCSWRWATMDWLPHRFVYFITTRRCLRGHGELSSHTPTIRRAYFQEEFLEGFLSMLSTMFSLGITMLIIAQFTEAESFDDVIDILRVGDQYALTSTLYRASNSVRFRTFLYSLISVPFVWGFIKGIVAYYSVSDAERHNRSIAESVTALEHEINLQRKLDLKGHIWYNGFRWFLPLQSLDRHLQTISRALRWDGRIDYLGRQKAHNALVTLNEVSTGFTRKEVGVTLSRILNSLNAYGFLIFPRIRLDCNFRHAPIVLYGLPMAYAVCGI